MDEGMWRAHSLLLSLCALCSVLCALCVVSLPDCVFIFYSFCSFLSLILLLLSSFVCSLFSPLLSLSLVLWFSASFSIPSSLPLSLSVSLPLSSLLSPSFCFAFTASSPSPLTVWEAGAASVVLTPPVNGTTDYVVPIDEANADSPGTCVPAFDQGTIPIGNGNSEVRRGLGPATEELLRQGGSHGELHEERRKGAGHCEKPAGASRAP